MMMGCYLTLSFWAVSRGLPAGIMALMGALQPLLTAAYMLIRGKESPSPSMWWGLTIGFVGVVFVLLPRIDGNQVLQPARAAYLYGQRLGLTVLSRLLKENWCVVASLAESPALPCAGSYPSGVRF
jgi:drug/metabolite transporter (DMT)-like permease